MQNLTKVLRYNLQMQYPDLYSFLTFIALNSMLFQWVDKGFPGVVQMLQPVNKDWLVAYLIKTDMFYILRFRLNIYAVLLLIQTVNVISRKVLC